MKVKLLLRMSFVTQPTGDILMKKAFTLIELLVVIAIIAILAAILFPVFAQAKTAAKKASAVSNAKQLALAELMYSNDYDDMVVPYFTGIMKVSGSWVYTSPQVYWPQSIAPYVQKVTGHGAGGANGTSAQALDTDLSGVYFDPIETFAPETAGTAHGYISSWGISDDLTNYWCPSNPVGVPSTFIPVNQGQVVAPAGTLIFTETWNWLSNYTQQPGCDAAMSFFDDGVYVPGKTTGWLDGAQLTLSSPYNASYQKTSFYQEPDPNGMNNTAFCDGHVKSMHTGQLTHSGQYWSIGNNDLWP
jgi:prepilin-type N-terminal cleavage/methylation domain-containing protein/prepilin-type processing-associated H-X9-DG protein